MALDEGGLGREALTVRQREVAALVARGYTNQQIAAEMVISLGTAANHVQPTLSRLGLNSRSELATWVSQRGLASGQNRLLSTLERLIEILPRDLDSALDAASLAVAEALRCEKVDAFLYEPSTSTLVARGTSPTPLGRKQHALGLHRLPKSAMASSRTRMCSQSLAGSCVSPPRSPCRLSSTGAVPTREPRPVDANLEQANWTYQPLLPSTAAVPLPCSKLAAGT